MYGESPPREGLYSAFDSGGFLYTTAALLIRVGTGPSQRVVGKKNSELQFSLIVRPLQMSFLLSSYAQFSHC